MPIARGRNESVSLKRRTKKAKGQQFEKYKAPIKRTPSKRARTSHKMEEQDDDEVREKKMETEEPTADMTPGAEREEEARTEESEEDAGNVTGEDKTEDKTEDESMYEGGAEDSFHSAGFPGSNTSTEEDGQAMFDDPLQILKFSIDRETATIGLPSRAEIFFKGCLKLRVIKGCLSVQGYTLSPSENFHSIYSPRGHSLLSLRASTQEQSSDTTSGDLENEEVIQSDVVIEVMKLQEAWIDFLKKGIKKSDQLKLFGRDTSLQEEDRLVELEKCLDITLFRPNTMSPKLWRQGQDWDVAFTSMDLVRRSGEQPRLLAAGGKGVGKSSFTRWMTNRLLEQGGEVIFLDLDPGQKEFGLPGYLTLAVIKAPLLGPNFCQPEPEVVKSIYFGDINVSNNPGRYIRTVSGLLRMLKKLDSKVPLVINTMGWCQGLGLLLNTDIIRLCKPTTLVQIFSRFPKKNYPRGLTSDYVNNGKSYSRVSEHLTYNHLEFAAVPERSCAKDMRGQDSWGIPQPAVLRDIQTLSWFGKRGGIKDLPVYSIHFSQVCLNVAHETVPPRGLLAALALQPVDLCAVRPDKIRQSTTSDNYAILMKSPIEESLGVGIVRGVDSEERLIYVATQVPEETLQKVNCLVGGQLSIPTGLLAKQKCPSPYLASDTPTNPLHLPWQKLQRHGQFSS